MSISCRRCLLFFLLLLAVLSSRAQPPQSLLLKGYVHDGEDGSPIQHALVRITDPSGVAVSPEAFTNFRGEIRTTVLLPSESKVVISALGYGTTEISADQVTRSPADDALLGEVALKRLADGPTHREQVHYPKITADSSEITLFDMLRSLPGVRVDLSGGFSIDGYHNIRFIVNDKVINPDEAKGRIQLSQMAGHLVKSIRILTPGELTERSAPLGGLVVVRLRRAQAKWQTSLELQHRGSDRYQAAAGLQYQAKKVDFAVDFSNDAGTYEGYGNLSRWRQEDLGQNTLRQHYRQLHYQERPELNARLDIRADPKTHFVLGAYWSHGQGQRKNTLDTDFIDETNGVSHFRQQRVTDLSYHEMNRNVSLRFDKLFSSAEHKLSAKLQYQALDDEQVYRFQNADFDMDGFTLLELLELTRNEINGDRNSWNFALEYTQPFRDKGALSFGWRTREDKWEYTFSHFNFDYTKDAFFEVPPLHNRFLYRKQYHQVYSSLYAELNSWTLLIKMEAEQFFTDVTTKIVDPAFEQDLFYLLPHIRVEAPVVDHSILFAQYQRQLDKPADRELSPFIDFTNLFYLSSGNPLLMPELKNSFALGFERMGDRTILRARLFHERINDRILPVLGVAPGNIALNRFENIDLSTDTGGELLLKSSIGRSLQTLLQVGGFQNRLQSEQADAVMDDQLWTFWIRWNIKARLGEDISASWNGLYHGETNLPQSVLAPYLASGVELKLKLLEDRVELGLGTDDLFNSSGRRLKTQTGGYEQVFYHRTIRRIFFVGTRIDFG